MKGSLSFSETNARSSVAIISADHTQPIQRDTFEKAKEAYCKIRGWETELLKPLPPWL